jgi:hypothetical protein
MKDSLYGDLLGREKAAVVGRRVKVHPKLKRVQDTELPLVPADHKYAMVEAMLLVLILAAVLVPSTTKILKREAMLAGRILEGCIPRAKILSLR